MERLLTLVAPMALRMPISRFFCATDIPSTLLMPMRMLRSTKADMVDVELDWLLSAVRS